MTGRGVIGTGAAVGVVGGGLLGLTVALRLAQAGARVTVFEGAADLGGLAAAASIPTPDGPISWDRFYHVTLASDAALLRLLGDLGLEEEILWTTTRTGYFAGGRLSPVSTPWEFLTLPGLSFTAKLRLALTFARGMTVRDWRALEQIPVERWLTRWSGPATFRRFWVPLLEAKLGDAWPDANAAFIWATMQRLTAARRAGIGDERFGAVAGGYGRVVTAITARLGALGARVLVGEAVTRLGSDTGGVDSRGAGGGRVEVVTRTGCQSFDDVIVTTSPRVAAALCPEVDAHARARLTAVRYQGVVCASVVLRRSLSPYYLTYLMDHLPFTAIVEMTALIPRAWVGGHALVYLPRYVAAEDPLFDRSDDEIRTGFLAGLQQVHPFDHDEVIAVEIARTREVFPLPVLRYSDTVPPRTTGIPGVHLVSSSQIVNGTLNVNETVALADRAARDLGVADPPTATP